MTKRITYAEINLSNYIHNLDSIKHIIGDSVDVMAIVKANAYGHGLEEIARAATEWGVRYLGVVSLGELSRIRSAKISTPCLLLNYLDHNSIEEAIGLNASFTVMNSHSIDVLNDRAGSVRRKLNVHIKIDTGMHRAGCKPGEVLKLAKSVVESPWLSLEGVFTHFGEAESSNNAFTKHQLAVFGSCLKNLSAAGIKPALVHAANSAATIAYPESHFSMVRIGILSYGLSPFDKTHDKSKFVKTNFRPVMSVKSKVIYVRQLSNGESVGYGRQWTAKRPSTVALVPIGYGDGYRRAPYHAKYALVNGRKVIIAGAISMDQTIFDVTDAGRVNVGDEVVLLGAQNGASISADDLAKDYKTINYEVVTAFTDRIERKYLS